MRLNTGYEGKKPRIEIVSLIDIVFLLLVFFIYAMLSMTVYKGVRVNLPLGNGFTENINTIIITITEDNNLWIDGKIVSLKEAVLKTKKLITDMENTPILIRSDRHADFGATIVLLSALKENNITSVSFQVKSD